MISRAVLSTVSLAIFALVLVSCGDGQPAPSQAVTPTPTAAPVPTSIATPTPLSAPMQTPTPAPTPTPELQYLTEETPPCTPIASSSADPCEPDVGGITDSSASEDLGFEPWSVRFYLDGGGGGILVGHLVLRGTYLPDTIRCIADRDFRSPSYASLGNRSISTGIASINCFADVRVNSYIVGSGPPTLTVLVEEILYWMHAEPEVVERTRSGLERAFIEGGYHPRVGVPAGGIASREAVLFIGPAVDVTTEVWEVFTAWDVQRQEDGTVIAVHPHRDYWRIYTDDYERYRSALEMDLPTFTQAVTTANQARLTEYGGRIGQDTSLPMLVSDANQLSSYFREVGAYDDPDNPPVQPPPP